MRKEHINFRAIILGCQRTGTTLLSSILNAGQIFMLEENWIWSYFFRERWHAGGVWHSPANEVSQEQKIWDDSVQEFAANTFEEYFRIKKLSRHSFWGVKAPGLNMARTIPYFASIFHDLKFVIIVRDPRDTFVSMRESTKMLNNLPEDFYSNSTNSPDLVELYYGPYSYWGKVYAALDEFCTTRPERSIVISYEKMLERPAKTVRDLCEFLEINFGKTMIEPFCRNISNASVVSMSYEDYNNEKYVISKSPIGRWEKELDTAEYIQIKEQSGEVAKKWSYTL